MSIVKDLLLILFVFGFAAVFFILNMKLNRCKRIFYEILNHNLKVTELAQLRGLDLLKTSCNQNLIAEIERSCEYNLAMINDLSRFYNNEKSYKFEINLSELITKVFNSLSEPADLKAVTFYYKIDGAEDIVVDGFYLEQILQILTEKILKVCKDKVACFVNVQKRKAEITIFYISSENIKSDFSGDIGLLAIGDGIKAELCKKLVSSMGGKLKFGNVKDNLQYVTFCVQVHSDTTMRKSTSISRIQPCKC